MIRAVARAVRFLGALAALAGLLAGVPALLVRIAPLSLPTRWPRWPDLVAAALRPDDGHLFIVALSLIAWAGWAAFALSAVVEILACLRGIPAVHLPGLGGPQGLAAALLASTAAVVSVAAVPGPPSRPPAATAPVAVHPLLVADTPTPATRDLPADLPTVTVRRGDTLWRLAEQYLGAGTRYREIADLNYGRLQPDGRRLTDTHWLRPGWILHLPADATPGTAPPAHDLGTVVVRPGDTLWSIARDRLGDASRYQEIAALNTHRPQPDGVTLTDPDLIHPGWTLALPPATSRDDARPAPSRPRPTPSPSPTTTRVPRPTATPASTSRPATPTVTAPPAPTGHRTVHPVDVPTAPLLPLGLGGLAAAALITHLRRQRRRQQATRRPGERIPQPSRAGASAEQRLRAGHRPDAPERVQAALAALATNCASAHRDLPAIAAILLAPDSLELVLAEDDAAPVAGFAPTGPRTWRHDPPTATPPPANGAPLPRPVLATVGAADDALILVNLEAAGILAIHGTPAEADAAQRALAVELVTSPLAHGATIALGPHLHELAAVAGTTRARAVDDPAEVARSQRGETLIHVRDDVRVVPQPWSGSALVTTAASDAEERAWTLDLHDDGSARLSPLGVDLVAQRLDEESYLRVLDLLGTAAVAPRIHVEPAAAPATNPAAIPFLSPSRRVHARAPDPAPPDIAANPAAPRVLLLGPVIVQGAHDEVVPNRRRRLTELVAYLALHPGATYHQVDEAMWPGMRVSTGTRNALVSRTRRWLGATPAGKPYLAVVARDGEYRLHPDVTCDWHDFLRLTQPSPGAASVAPDRLARALALVRGRPFLGVDPRDYGWAESDIQQMISAVVDVAHELATVRLDAGDHRGAQDAASQGLLAEPCSELLYRDAMRAAAARGDRVEVTRLAERFRAQLGRLDPSSLPEEETVELLATAGYRWT